MACWPCAQPKDRGAPNNFGVNPMNRDSSQRAAHMNETAQCGAQTLKAALACKQHARTRSMVLLARIVGGHGSDRRLPRLASASAKLVRAYCTILETRRRPRGGGEQSIAVKDVSVHQTGQATVGTVTPRTKK